MPFCTLPSHALLRGPSAPQTPVGITEKKARACHVPWIGEAQREKTVSEIFSSDAVNSVV